jgi:hypothetical protein
MHRTSDRASSSASSSKFKQQPEELDRHINEEDIEQLWRRRQDRIAINRDKRIIYIIEFKR